MNKLYQPKVTYVYNCMYPYLNCYHYFTFFRFYFDTYLIFIYERPEVAYGFPQDTIYLFANFYRNLVSCLDMNR